MPLPRLGAGQKKSGGAFRRRADLHGHRRGDWRPGKHSVCWNPVFAREFGHLRPADGRRVLSLSARLAGAGGHRRQCLRGLQPLLRPAFSRHAGAGFTDPAVPGAGPRAAGHQANSAGGPTAATVEGHAARCRRCGSHQGCGSGPAAGDPAVPDSRHLSGRLLEVHPAAHHRPGNGFLDGDENQFQAGEPPLVAGVWLGDSAGLAEPGGVSGLLHWHPLHLAGQFCGADVCL